MIAMPNYILASLAASLFVSMLIMLTKHWHGRFSMDHTEGVQKFHTKPTPRIGGVGLLAGLLIAWTLAPSNVNVLLQPMLLASIPAFTAGLIEDITKKVGILARLVATMVSGVAACWLTGLALNRADVPLLDTALTIGPVAILFTAFAVAGVANAINIIDGFNGLSSGTVLIILTALGSMAQLQGDAELAATCAVVATAVLGFWLVNFPLGKLFLGDGGAYLAGFALAWLSVLLLIRHPHISPWVALLACSYPVIEVLYSMWRRKRQRLPTGAPDNLHLHSLVKTQVIMRVVPHWHHRLRNAAVSPLMWIYAAVPAALAVLLQNSSVWAVIFALLTCVLWYHISYVVLSRRAKHHPEADSGPLPLAPNHQEKSHR